MATERQSPDVLLEQTNLTGTVSEIQDDPDSPDANWLDAVANNVASICRTSFPTPTGNPTVGADLQEFRVLVRKYGGTGTPTAWIELYENGVLIRAGTAQDVTGNLVISFTWNANEIGTADGSLVECRLNSTAIGGSPSTRACVEVGAVEWNVTYSIGGVTEYLAGVVNGVAAVSGITKATRKVAVATVGIASVSGAARVSKKITGAISALAFVSGAAKVSKTIAGVIGGVASVTGGLTVTVTKYLAGTIAGVASITGNLTIGAIELLAGVVSGIAQVSGAVALTKKLIGAIQGIGSVSGGVKVIHVLVASVSGIATTSGVAKVSKKLVGAIAGAATTTASLTIGAVGVALAGIINGVATITARLSYHRRLKILTGITISQDLNFTTKIKHLLRIATSSKKGVSLETTTMEK